MDAVKKINWTSIIMANALLFCMVWMLCLVSPAVASNFPGRDKFPDVPYIVSDDLFKAYESGDAIIVDVRSSI